MQPPRQLIHIHPFSAEQDIPDYDLDSEDELWLCQQAARGELLPLLPPQFEEMMDTLEKSSGLKAVTLQEAKLLLKDDDDLITAVYDYWLNKRLKLQHALIPQVKVMRAYNSMLRTEFRIVLVGVDVTAILNRPVFVGGGGVRICFFDSNSLKKMRFVDLRSIYIW